MKCPLPDGPSLCLQRRSSLEQLPASECPLSQALAVPEPPHLTPMLHTPTLKSSTNEPPPLPETSRWWHAPPVGCVASGLTAHGCVPTALWSCRGQRRLTSASPTTFSSTSLWRGQGTACSGAQVQGGGGAGWAVTVEKRPLVLQGRALRVKPRPVCDRSHGQGGEGNTWAEAEEPDGVWTRWGQKRVVRVI